MTTQTIPDTTEQWFDEFIAFLRSDQIQISAGIAPKEKLDFYNVMMSGDLNKILYASRSLTSVQFIKNILYEFSQELKQRNCKPLQLSVNYSDARVLVWAIVNDDDENTEDDLLMAEAKINAKYHQFGFHISSTILEASDNYPIPPQYRSILPN
ncbi:MAG: hypothetical protein NTU51_10615 [Bacteroidetes bacterium]|nr:hypothetical protein [Bacteroidota bacterium]